MNTPPAIKRTFEGRAVLLTGAGSGIGRSLALQLVSAGARVHAADVNPEGLATLASDSAGGPGVVIPRQLDVTDREAYRVWVGDCHRAEGRIDYLFNNAGVTLLGEAHKVPFERWRWLLDINLMGVINGVMHVYPLMVAQRGGHIVSTASVAGVTGYATAAAYTMAKGGVIGLSRSLEAEAKDYGVKVSVVCPGYVNSGIFSQDRVVGADLGKVIGNLPAPMMEANAAGLHYLKGVASGKRTIVFPANAKLLWFVANWMPSLLAPLQKRLLKDFE